MDTLRNFLFPKRFSIVAYVFLILQIVIGCWLASITVTDKEKFSCTVNTKFATHKTNVETTCFSSYEETYNSPLNFWLFVVISFAYVMIISFFYSMAVGKCIDETESNSTGNGGLLQTARMTFYVFNCYTVHLVVRSVFGISLTILQHTLLYPIGFDEEYSCEVDPNITAANNASSLPSSVSCRNTNTMVKQKLDVIISAYNVIFAVIALAEVIYLILHRYQHFNCCSNDPWSCDSDFIVVYFLRKPRVRFAVAVYDRIPLTQPDSSNIYKQKVLELPLTRDKSFGPKENVDDLFIDVVIKTGQAPHKFSKCMDRHEINEVYKKFPEHSIRLEKIKDLFYPNRDTKPEVSYPRTILALGRPGIGKTVLTKKIMRDWANPDPDNFYCGKIAFYFRFRWFCYDELQNISLKKFLQLGTTFTKVEESKFESIFHEIWKNPQNAIFIFDGLDEIGNQFENFKSFLERTIEFCGDPMQSPMSPLRIFIKILSGKILPEATVLVTSRPTAIDVYSEFYFERKVEIIGFTLEKIEEYVEKFCACYDKNNKTGLKTKISSYIRSSSEVTNLCYIPVNCSITCSTVQNSLSDSTDDNRLPTTLTALYQKATIFIGRHLRVKSVEYYEKVIKELQELAFNGMETGDLDFPGESVTRQMKESGLLQCVSPSSGLLDQIHTRVSFIHLTVQEFLAAQHIVETKEPKDIKEFITSHVKDGSWHLVLQFLAGLLRKKVPLADQYKSCVLAYTEHLRGKIDGDRVVCCLDSIQILRMKCLRETENEEIAKEIATTSALKDVTSIQTVHGEVLSPSDATAMVFVCKYLNILTDLSLRGIMNLDCLLEVTKLLEVRCIKSLRLRGTYPGDLGLQHVLSALMKLHCQVKHEHCKLAELVLGNEIDNSDLFLLWTFLKDGHGSGLKTLSLAFNKITSSSSRLPELAEILSSQVCKQLTVLNLSNNNIGNEGVQILCKGLKGKQSKLRELHLESCSLTNACISCLVDVLSDEHCGITDLLLSSNNIGDDEGVCQLFGDLLKGQCNLTKLNMSNCSLTNKFISTLQNGLCRLTSLNLGYNDIGSEGVCMLCSILRKEECKFAVLDLCDCSWSIECMPSLCEALGDERCGLTSLDLAENKIGDEDACKLFGVLKKEQCKLAVLNLSRCALPDECIPSLCEALRDERCRLTKLYLSGNDFTDKHVPLLTDVLKLEHCCLQYLNIERNTINEEGNRLLNDAMNSNCCKDRGLEIVGVW